MSAPRSVTLATQTEAVKVLQLEMMALQELIHRDYATKLAAIDQNLAHEQIVNRTNALAHEKQIRLNLLARSEEVVKCNEMWMNNTCLMNFDSKASGPRPPLPIFMFKSSKPKPEELQDEIELLTTTIKITKKLISDPENLANTITELTDHGIKLDAYLNNKTLAAKKKTMWADIVFAVAILLAITLIMACLVIPMTIPMGLTFGGMFAFIATSTLSSIASFGAGLALNEAIKPSKYIAESNIEICKQAQAFYIPKR